MTTPGTSWRDNLRADLPASLVVFLVALPLCLGVALASGAPLVAGLIAGVIGGLVVAPLSGSNLMVSGPAAGLTAVVLAAIGKLGGFDVFLTALVLAGIMQLGFGLAKAGFIAKYFPSSVIKGMLAAIGITLVLKQIPHAMGYDAEAMGLEQFHAVGNENTFTSITHLAGRINPTAVILSVVSLLILFLWDNPRFKGLKRIPAALVVVVLGTVANELIVRFWPARQLTGDELVQVPVGGIAAYVGEVTLPRWDVLLQPQVWVVAATIALVASLETLLSLEATDKLDPLKRHSSADRELRAQGIGNFLAGMVGGLPLTGVIVRSAANIESGGRTRTSAIAHSVWLLLAMLLIPGALNRMPLAALAAILIHVGWKLAHPMHLLQAWRIGRDQFIPFTVTIVAILFTDLLVGVIIGLLVGAFFILKEQADAPGLTVLSPPGAVLTRYALGQQATFLTKVRIEKTLNALPPGSRVEIDARDCRRIDPDVLQLLHDFRHTAAERNIDYRLVAVPELAVNGATLH
jgi:MFS superfamily sulfate permease-like transporter